MQRWLALSDGLLRAESWTVEGLADSRDAWRHLAALGSVMGAFGLLYGATMGAFGGIAPDRLAQVLYSAVKVPLLLAVTFALSLPSFFVVNSLLGLRDDFGQVLRALVATQAGLTIVLAALAPLTAVWYLSSAEYALAKLFNGLMFLAASVAGQAQLRRHYRPLVARRPAHGWMMRAWLVVYAFVGIQLAWVLRPFIGAPDAPTTFFREGAWSNAYVEIGRLLLSVIRG